ncbi:uncharacterized protein LY89DRAFT_688827 [Mollisia scopiformis]|uniref:Uncharacterized protein n=1 Tax=Mollisia scopiformis TaxID=149040 RepID=A0A194WUJ6_MOLSC|nr:uncharacterized protein LY89DRAFT_688827 [Mollisia scopiformis]KUJ11638.1 hypothetical protein LY89DRAFT_688827 [Mollisia scopiformis]
MYTKQVIVALAAFTAASAAVLPRQVVTPEPAQGAPSGTYSITSFQVDQLPGSLYTTYTLQVTDPSNPSTAPDNTSTTCSTEASTLPAIAGFQDLSCDDPSVKWSFVANSTGYNLEIKHNWGEQVQHAIFVAYDNVTDTATAFFPSSDVKNNPNAEPGQSAPYLDAPASFDLEYYRYIS